MARKEPKIIVTASNKPSEKALKNFTNAILMDHDKYYNNSSDNKKYKGVA